MYMDDIKLFVKNVKELETLIQILMTCTDNIGLKFGIEKCAILIMKSGKQQISEGIELLNQRKIRTFGE